MLVCPSRLEISRWEPFPETERPAELAKHVAACPRCAAMMAEISEARSLLLGGDPAEASARAARAILECVRERRSRSLGRWWRLLVPALLVPAVAALLVIGKPALLGLRSTGHSTQAVKGELLVEIFCKRGDAIFPAVDGGDFLEGDRLRFAYSKERPGYLMVFGVDDNGRVFPYYDEQALVGVRVEAGSVRSRRRRSRSYVSSHASGGCRGGRAGAVAGLGRARWPQGLGTHLRPVVGDTICR